jgi:hypothetical protein
VVTKIGVIICNFMCLSDVTTAVYKMLQSQGFFFQ